MKQVRPGLYIGDLEDAERCLPRRANVTITHILSMGAPLAGIRARQSTLQPAIKTYELVFVGGEGPPGQVKGESYTRRVRNLYVPIFDLPTANLLQLLPQCLDFIDSALNPTPLTENSDNKNQQQSPDPADALLLPPPPSHLPVSVAPSAPPPSSTLPVHNAVLVHCFAGVSRSASVVVAYLMQKEKLSFKEAFLSLKRVHPHACPNQGFREQLQLFHSMGYCLDRNNPAYKKYCLELMSRRRWGFAGAVARLPAPPSVPGVGTSRVCSVIIRNHHPNATHRGLQSCLEITSQKKSGLRRGAGGMVSMSLPASSHSSPPRSTCPTARPKTGSQPVRGNLQPPPLTQHSQQPMQHPLQSQQVQQLKGGASKTVVNTDDPGNSSPPLTSRRGVRRTKGVQGPDGTLDDQLAVTIQHHSATNSVKRASDVANPPGHMSPRGGVGSVHSKQETSSSGVSEVDPLLVASRTHGMDPSREDFDGRLGAYPSKQQTEVREGKGIEQAAARNGEVAEIGCEGADGNRPDLDGQGTHKGRGFSGNADNMHEVRGVPIRVNKVEILGEKKGAREVCLFRCRRCRNVVASGENLLPHEPAEGGMGLTRWQKKGAPPLQHPGNRAHSAGIVSSATLGESRTPTMQQSAPCGECSSIFVEPLEWMTGVADGEKGGKLSCHKCSARLGSFDWGGLQCSCGTLVTPAFQLHKSRIDVGSYYVI